jgi:hypothetical protein
MGLAIGFPLIVLIIYHIFKLIQLIIIKHTSKKEIISSNNKKLDKEFDLEKKKITYETEFSEYFHFND